MRKINSMGETIEKRGERVTAQKLLSCQKSIGFSFFLQLDTYLPAQYLPDRVSGIVYKEMSQVWSLFLKN